MVKVRRHDTLMQPDALDWDLDSADPLQCRYDKKRDILYLAKDPKQPAVSLDVAGQVWLRLDLETDRVIGLEVEDFESAFLHIHPDLRQSWELAKPTIANRKPTPPQSDFLRVLLQELRVLVSSRR